MSSILAPFGMRPIQKLGGTPASLSKIGAIATGYATAIGLYQPIKITAGLIVAAVGTAAGDTTGGICGTFLGVEYTDVVGRRVESNQWPASTTATNIIAYFCDDPYITYEAQGDGPIAQANLYNELDFNTASQNTTTGLCTTSLKTSTLTGSGTQYLVRVVGITPGADNAYGDAYTIVQIMIAKHQWVTPAQGIS